MTYLIYVAIVRCCSDPISLAAGCADLFPDRTSRIPESSILGSGVWCSCDRWGSLLPLTMPAF